MTLAPTEIPKHCTLAGTARFIGSHVAGVLVEVGHEVLALDELSGGFSERVPIACRRVGKFD